jgi:hypothetical protein
MNNLQYASSNSRNHEEWHIAGQNAAGCDHFDVARGRPRRNGCAYKRVRNHREVCRNSVERNVGGPDRPLPENAAVLSDLAHASHEGDEWTKACGQTEDSATPVVLRAVFANAASVSGPVESPVSRLKQAVGTVTPPCGSRIRELYRKSRPQWPALTQSGHVEPSTFKKQHAKALKRSGVRPFVLYSARHTFLTRLGENGCDTWTLARIAGHNSICNIGPLRPSVSRCGFGSYVSAGWAQNWAQSRKCRTESNAGGTYKCSSVRGLNGGQCRTRTCDLLLVRQAL